MSYQYCGTARGYDDHRKANEPPCKWCVKAVTKPEPIPAEVMRKYTRPAAQCATESGYARHKRLGEEACTECKAAAAAAARKRKAKTRPPKTERTLTPCGTPGAYARHRRNNEQCDPCRLAANERRRKYRKKH